MRRVSSCCRVPSSRASGSSRSGLLDVVRSASAEIADFPRVELVGVDDELAVSGRAVADLAHLVAELLENATSFSPPDAAVVVSGANTASGFVLAVSDQGIGMPPEKIAEANQLLAKPPVVGLALSRALGLHVVGVARGSPRHHRRAAARRAASASWRSSRCRRRSSSARPPRPPPAPPVFAPDVGPDGSAHAARRASRRVASGRRAAGGGVAAEGLADPEPARDARGDAPRRRHRAEPCSPSPASSKRRRSSIAPRILRVEVPSVSEEPPFGVLEAPHAKSRSRRGAAFEEPGDAPLPTRVPGHHLSHQPTVAGDEQSPRPIRSVRTACTNCSRATTSASAAGAPSTTAIRRIADRRRPTRRPAVARSVPGG